MERDIQCGLTQPARKRASREPKTGFYSLTFEAVSIGPGRCRDDLRRPTAHIFSWASIGRALSHNIERPALRLVVQSANVLPQNPQ